MLKHDIVDELVIFVRVFKLQRDDGPLGVSFYNCFEVNPIQILYWTVCFYIFMSNSLGKNNLWFQSGDVTC